MLLVGWLSVLQLRQVAMASISVEVREDEIAEYLREAGWHVSKTNPGEEELDREELEYLLTKIDDTSWLGRRVYDKIHKLRFK